MDVYPSALNHAIFQQVWVVLKDLLPKKKIKRDSIATRSPYSLFFKPIFHVYFFRNTRSSMDHHKKQKTREGIPK